ncbi:MAG: hypothetical protein CM15mP18_3230 [Methanobacteriota archaeon]|nr:MAG: hypothetical protein CM15mP18_3230 [Euryarchaeota archaeon]
MPGCSRTMDASHGDHDASGSRHRGRLPMTHARTASEARPTKRTPSKTETEWIQPRGLRQFSATVWILASGSTVLAEPHGA